MTDYLTRNLAALGQRQPDLAAALIAAPRSPAIDAVPSTSGAPVPRIVLAGGPRLLHSSVDPRREASRAGASHPRGEYLVCLGLGGGYHLAPLRERPDTQRLVVAERDMASLRTFLSIVDHTALLEDPRVHLVCAEDPAILQGFLTADYHPAIYRSFAVIPLASWVDVDRAGFAALADAVRIFLDAVSRDHTTQARFGLRWHRNIIANLDALGRTATRPGQLADAVGDVLVTGAGPSLDGQMERLRACRDGAYLIATDASATPLAAAGIRPDMVLSIDCQHVVYHHFFRAPPPGCTLVMDIASPPFLGRLGAPTVHLATRHPLARYLVDRGAPFPTVDVAGGNVGYAAVSLARSMGARSVRLFGVDLSYPRATPYARGAFFNSALAARVERTHPLESWVATHVLGSPSARRVPTPAGASYLTATMDDYRRSLRSLAASGPRVIPEPGDGPPIELTTSPAPGSPRRGAPEPAPWHPREHLERYAAVLRSLPSPGSRFAEWLTTLDRERRAALSTILPVASTLQGRLGYPATPELLESARSFSLEAVTRALSSPGT